MKRKRKKKFKFKIDFLSSVMIIISFVGGMVYQGFINKKLLDEKKEMMHEMLGEFLGSKITFHTNLNGEIYMFVIGREEHK